MSRHTLYRYTGGAALALGALLAWASPAEAQPNPFDAWRAAQESPQPQPDGATPQPAPAPAPQAPAIDWGAPLRAGRFTLSGHVLYAGTTTTNGLIDGGEADNSTLFLDLAPSFGWFVIDRLEVYGTVGLLVSQLDRNQSGDATTATQARFGVGARYYLPLHERFSVFGGLGLGGATGGSTRQITVTPAEGEPQRVEQDTDTRAFALDLEVGAAYLLTPSVQLRAGVALVGLWGSETVDSQDLDTSLLHNGVRLGVAWSF
jgi:opacity protein-like surface antigen